jgi:hypothetical protein
MVAECVIAISWGGQQVRTGLTVRNRYEIELTAFSSAYRPARGEKTVVAN